MFILHPNGAAPSHLEMDGIYDELRKSGYRISASTPEGRVLAAERTTVDGALVVTNDFCTHVLEVAFPPFNDLERFQRVYVEEDANIRAVLRKTGLEIRPGAALNPSGEISTRPKANDPNGIRLEEILNRPVIDHPLFHPALPACIASTQVSLGIPEAEAIRCLRGFYEFEPLVPIMFGNSQEFNDVRLRCVRPLAWMANFPASSCLLGIPHSIPNSLSEYERMQNTSNTRDYSFVSIRSSDRVEFRSACSQDSAEDILWLIRFRLAVDVACARFAPSHCNPRERFIETCTFGPRPWCQELFQKLIEIDPMLEALSDRLT